MKVSNFFTFPERLQMSSMEHRLKRSQTINANIANSETPGFRAIGYDFEDQLQSMDDSNVPLAMKVSHDRHKKNELTNVSGKVEPDVYVRPTESVGEDGNTVDVDLEMADLAQNQLLYRTSIETLTRKIGLLKYAINGGR